MSYVFEWDQAKNLTNQQKHDGISFEEASKVFGDPLHISIQDRVENGERRWQTFGEVGDLVLLMIAHTLWEEDEDGEQIEIVRIISARKATRKERLWYENAHR